MRTYLTLCLAAAPALAFTPQAPLNAATQNGLSVAPHAPRQVRVARGMSCPTCMSAEGGFNMGAAARTFAGILAVGSTFLPGASFASAGDAPKISIFGAEPASSPYVADTVTYSPYSPYGTGKESIYKVNNPEAVARAKAKVAETEKRVAKIPTYVSEKKWTEVVGELDRFMGVTRQSMNTLASASAKPAAKKLATAFYEDIETINTAAVRKDAKTIEAAYKKATADLSAFKSAL